MLHMQSLVRFEVVGNMHFVMVEGKEVVGIANLGDNWEHYYRIVVVMNYLQSINS